ncbi:uncharacterized protein LOC143452898 [Clavelina lepadiformis]|uniref:uncharacterized protein LOC143452898 n=1 Tax=Clavelina lepadiformis TaxID=159417 RepID=UPI00404337AF
MKVICAGMSKTGTKSLRAALTLLGYNVYDFLENYQYLGGEWNRIASEGGTTEDFRRMFENVDAVTDMPGCSFWDEIHKAFPDAKIIFTTRDEDSWLQSVEHQMAAEDHPLVHLMMLLSPTYWKLDRFMWRIDHAVSGTGMISRFLRGVKINRLLTKMAYRKHNANVLQNAPKDKLLVYSVKEGWKPLCKFLGVDVPSKPFPHKNKQGQMVEELMAKHPIYIRGEREVMFFGSLLLLMLVLGVYIIVTRLF